VSDKSEKEIVLPEFNAIIIGKRGLSPHDDEFAALYPKLYSAIMPRYDDKKRLTREAGRLAIAVDGSLFRVTLTCPTEEYQLTLSVVALFTLWDQLEAEAFRPDAPWVPTYDAKKKAKAGLAKGR